MDKLDGVVIDHIEREFLDPSRLEIVLSAVLDRRQERGERRREHIAELNKRAPETELRLKRLYDAIEAGVTDLDDPALKDRIEGLRAFAQRVEVAEREVFIKGSKDALLRTLVAIGGGKSAEMGVPSSGTEMAEGVSCQRF